MVEPLPVKEYCAGSSPAPGVLVGWPSGKAPVLKTGERESVRGFESYTYRYGRLAEWSMATAC